MKLDKIVAVSGMSGLYNIVASRTNGIVVGDMDTGKTRFCSVRKHQFTPLETVSIYTQLDTVPLKDVFTNMRDKAETIPPVSIKGSSGDIEAYFAQILPDYDDERVHVSDMRKIIKWYMFLDQRQLLLDSDEEE